MSESWGQPQQPGGDWSVPQGGNEPGSFGPPPVDPQYGAPAPQYGGYEQPQQQPPQYGMPPQQPYEQPTAQFGAPPQFGGQVPPTGGYGYPMPPQDQKNGFALAGLILSFTVVLGAIFSALGLGRAGKIGGKGKGLAVAGLVLSILFGIGWGVLISKAVANSTALDPGCTSAESAFQSMLGSIQTDESKLSSDSSDQTAMQADLAKFTTDVQGIKSALDSSLAKAQHQSVKDKIQAMDTDINTVLTGLKAIQNGDTSSLSDFEAAAGRLGSDGTDLDNVCSSL